MRFLVVLGLSYLSYTLPALAQTHVVGADVGATYQWTHTNTLPGQCGCFSLNGGGISASLQHGPRWAIVGDVSAGYQHRGPFGPGSLTVVSYMGGVRSRPPLPWAPGRHTPEPFVQVLLGAAHAGGSIAGEGDHQVAFAGSVGGGIDLPLAGGFALRVAQLDYYATTFANTTNDHQNNLQVGSGFFYRWWR